jgi:Mg2+ and Co2+ transporter CorA
MNYDELKERLAELREELHKLYLDAASNADAIDDIAREVMQIQEDMDNVSKD